MQDFFKPCILKLHNVILWSSCSSGTRSFTLGGDTFREMIQACGKRVMKASVFVTGKNSIRSSFVRVCSSYAAANTRQGNRFEAVTGTGDAKALNFNDPKSAYRSKTTREILRAIFVFKLCSVNFLVDNNHQV